jgi:hypothetical protein
MAVVATLAMMGAVFSYAAMAGNSARFSPAQPFLSRLKLDEKTLVTDMQELRRHLRRGPSRTQIALERAQIHRDWQNIVAERGSKPAELSSRVAIFGPSWWFSPRWHVKKRGLNSRV